MKPVTLDKFLGLNNTNDSSSLPLEALSIAENIIITNYGDIMMRPGYAPTVTATNITGSYGVNDNSAMYVVEAGSLYKFDGSSFSALASGITSQAIFWCEESASMVFMASDSAFIQIINGQFINNLAIPKLTGLSVTMGGGNIPAGEALIAAQYYTASGRYGPMSDPIKVSSAVDFNILASIPELAGFSARIVAYLPDEGEWTPIASTNNFIVINSLSGTGGTVPAIYFDTISPPLANVVAATYFMSRVVVATLAEDGTSRISFSLPQFYHLFSATDDYMIFPDTVTDIESVNDTLIITGLHCIYAYSNEIGLKKLADYGTPRGKPITILPEGGCNIWTNRGMCEFPSFKNLTEDTVSLPPGDGASLSLFDYKGSRYLLCCNDGGGKAYNAIQ